MKLKKMITVCRKDGVLAVADDDSSGRWIGNVRFWWSGELYSGMSAEDICMVNDISRKQIDNMLLYDKAELPEWKDAETAEAEEVRLAGYDIVFGGREIVVLYTDGAQYLLLDADALAPWNGLDAPELYLIRDAAGLCHIKAMEGMIPVGLFELESADVHEQAQRIFAGRMPVLREEEDDDH